MRLVFRAILGVLALFAALTVTRVSSAQLLSPGPLSKAHGSLEGDTHCGDCHSSGKRVDQGLCLKCHNDLGARINAGQGLHGKQYKGQACEGCHVEHLGSSTIKWPGGGQNNLDHAQTGWPLNGGHKPLACNKCHTKTTPKGNATFLGLSTTCGSCHKDPHDNRFGANCTDCHNETSWTDLPLKSFNHDLAKFQLRGAHTTVQCVKCHNTPPKYTGLKFAACTDCHTDPHAGKLGAACADCHEDTKWKPVTFKQANAKHPGISLANGHANVACGRCHDKGNLASPSRGSACVSCHRAVHKAPFGNGCGSCHGNILWFGVPRALSLTSHAKTVFPLDGKHGDATCSGCHKASLPEETRYRKLTFGRCSDCHEDKHQGEFARLDRGECKPCHSAAGFRPTLFGVDLHDSSTRFALAGKHTAAPCTSCHTARRPLLDLHVAKQACADCHQNPHGTQFATEMASGGCAHCHEAAGWNVPKINHATWPLTGAHAAAACESCHKATEADRKAGQGPSYKGIPRNCSGCHNDQHLGQFRLTAPVKECDGCHTTGAFKLPNFDHASTGWALTGAHVNKACASCHPTVTIGTSQTVRWRTASHECSFCHANPHDRRAPASPTPASPTTSAEPNTKVTLAAAAPPAAEDTSAHKSFADAVPCSACHSTTAWKSKDGVSGAAPGFDHATTGFPLTGQHTKVSCVSCHGAATIKRDCVTCHEDSHRGRLSQSCDRCHSPTGWRVTRPLEVHRMTRFPLTGMHVLADCTQCHVRASEQRFTDAPVECYACHQQDYRRPGIFPHQATATTPALPRDCSMCHRSIAWVPANVPGLASSSAPLESQSLPSNHDLRFPVSSGSHRGAACNDCHMSTAAPRAVRCVGCHTHDPTVLMQQHKRPMATDGASCLTCHPGGVRR